MLNLQRKLRLSTKGDNRVSRRSSGATEARGAVEGIFHFHWKVKVAPTLSLLLFSWYICQCLKRARGRKYSTINVSKFLPASNCSKKTFRNQIIIPISQERMYYTLRAWKELFRVRLPRRQYLTKWTWRRTSEKDSSESGIKIDSSYCESVTIVRKRVQEYKD